MKTKNKEIIKVSAHGQITVPTALRKKLRIKENSWVAVQSTGKGIYISPVEVKAPSSDVSGLDSMESDPLFATFINAIGIHAMKHPDKLRDPALAWSPEVIELFNKTPHDDEE